MQKVAGEGKAENLALHGLYIYQFWLLADFSPLLSSLTLTLPTSPSFTLKSCIQVDKLTKKRR